MGSFKSPVQKNNGKFGRMLRRAKGFSLAWNHFFDNVSFCDYTVAIAIRRGKKVLAGDYGGWVAQSVEQRTENPCVGGSIPPPATI
jgi:hypothetical protein